MDAGMELGRTNATPPAGLDEEPSTRAWDVVELALNNEDLVWTKRVDASDDIGGTIPESSFSSTTDASASRPAVTLILVEGVDDDLQSRLRASFPSIPDRLFDFHLSETISLGQKWLRDDDGALFFAKWLRRECQEKESRYIEGRIQAGWPFDVSTVEYPHRLRLDHSRYSRISKPYRTYSSLTSDGGAKSEIPLSVVAAYENVSMWFTESDQGHITGVLLFDPPRRLRVASLKYKVLKGGLYSCNYRELPTFLPSSPTTRGRCVERLGAGGVKHMMGDSSTGRERQDITTTLSRERVFSTCKSIVASLAIVDETRVLDNLGQTLDKIELSIAKENTVRSALHSSRVLFGWWRNALFHQSQSFKRLRDDIVVVNAPEASGENRQQGRELIDIRDEIELLRDRLDRVFKTLMSTMSILESERAIQEAEVVTKLTSLAFFFIPLTFVASVFGANIIEFEEKLTAWLWIVCSVATTALTYLVLHWKELVRQSASIPGLIRGLSMRRLSAAATQWLRVGQAIRSRPQIPVSVLLIAVLAAFAVAAWEIATSTTRTAQLSSASPTTSTTATGVSSIPTTVISPGSVENSAPCYGFNGTFKAGYYPCQTFDVPVSQCCPSGWTCFSNALCITTNPVVFLPNVTMGSVLRSACTNPLWTKSVCGDYCLTDDEDEDSAKIIPCGDDLFCCGYELSRDLCDCGSGNGTFSLAPGIAQTIIGVAGPIPKGTPTLSKFSVSATASGTSTAVPKYSQPVTETIGFKMGMLAAGAVVLIVVVIAGGFLYWGPRSKRRQATG